MARPHVAVRLTEEQLARVDALAPLYSQPWREARRSDILRAIILRGLAIIEAEQERSAKRGRKRS